jgi:hypothetical protein
MILKKNVAKRRVSVGFHRSGATPMIRTHGTPHTQQETTDNKDDVACKGPVKSEGKNSRIKSSQTISRHLQRLALLKKKVTQ